MADDSEQKRALVFAGTTEGGAIVSFLCSNGVKVHACVATEYGCTSVPDCGAEISDRPLAHEEMVALMREYPVVVDATHPYASSITAHIVESCAEAGASYLRIDRPSTDVIGNDVVVVADMRSAVEYIKNVKGNVLVTTGSKDAAMFTEIPGFKDRIFLRVLSVEDSVSKCISLGFEGRNLFAMQGPFCEDLDYGMMVQTGAKFLLTKDTGGPGGFPEKLRAARRAHATTIVVSRPGGKAGVTYPEAVKILSERFSISSADGAAEPFRGMGRRRLVMVGTGVGEGTGLTQGAVEAIRRSDLVVGAERMLAIPEASGRPQLMEYMPERIFEYLAQHPEYRNIVILLSGDVGFYSAARAIMRAVDPKEYDTFAHCGISSVQYLCARVGVPWQDVKLISSHGRVSNLVGEVRRYGAVFTLLEGEKGAREMCDALEEYGLGGVTVMVGSDMGSDKEAFVFGTPSEVRAAQLGTLCAALIFNSRPDYANPISIPDSEFITGDAPMTKSEVRALSVAKLKVGDRSIVYDIGAGTGSVSVELARTAVEGSVYAVEKEEAAADLIEMNRKKMCTPNVHVVRGVAPDVLADLPAPTRVFIGGSSGNLVDIVNCVLAKNPRVRIVVNAITLETVDEIRRLPETCKVDMLELVCVNVAGSRKVGRYHLMFAQNPVYIAVFKGNARWSSRGS